MPAPIPTAIVAVCQDPAWPRRELRAFSRMNTAAAPSSPPAASPCAARRSTSRIGASRPMVAYPGSNPTPAVATGHQKDDGDQHGSTPTGISQPTEDKCAERPDDQGSAIDGEGSGQRRGQILGGKEDEADDGRQGAVDGEVVPLCGVADACCRDGLPRGAVRIGRVLGPRQRHAAERSVLAWCCSDSTFGWEGPDELSVHVICVMPAMPVLSTMGFAQFRASA